MARKKQKSKADSWSELLHRLPEVPSWNSARSEQFTHDLRILIKCLLALLEMIKSGCEKDSLRTFKLQLKGTADALALSRDPVVLEKTFKSIVKKFDLKRRKLMEVEFHTYFQPQHPANSNLLSQGAQRVSVVLHELQSIELANFGALAQAGIRRTYKTARLKYKIARERKKAKDLHCWRRWTKFLFLQMKLMFGAEFANQGHSKKLNQLQKCLGEHHDLSTLRKFLKQNQKHHSKKLLQCVLQRIDQKRELIEKRALNLGSKLFSRHRHPDDDSH